MATPTKNLRYTDLEQNYVKKKIILSFYHIPSGNTVSFKGRITKLSDNYVSSWNSEEVYGRSDPIANFKNTKRQISLAWQLVAADLEEAKSNLSKVSLLINFLYPTYSGMQGGASTITASPLLKMKFTNLISNAQDGGGLVGFVDGGLAFNPSFDDEFFDPAPGKLYPQAIDLSVTFTVLHTHPLGWGVDRQVRQGKFPYGQSLAGGGYKKPSPQHAQGKTCDSNADKFTETTLSKMPQSKMDNQNKANESQICDAKQSEKYFK